MWRIISRCATRRERNTSSSSPPLTTLAKKFQHNVAIQLDYYMSPQFAGVACAIVNNDYQSKGLNVSFLPTCPVGHEQANVRKHKDANPSVVTMGTVEQNIFIPQLAADPSLKVTAVAAMFGTSPLCLASLKDPMEGPLKIGTHEDTVEIMKRIFPSHDVVASPRSTKINDLLSGAIGATQAYTTTEVPTLQRHVGKDDAVIVTPLEGCNDAKLGYSQVLFTADESLQGDERAVVQAVCEATFDGWAHAIRHPDDAVAMVKEARKLLGLNDEDNDHWFPSADFEKEMVRNCNDYVKGTFEGDRYGVIHAKRWNEANEWLLNGKSEGENYGMDADVWQPPANLLPGNALARSILKEAKASATFFNETYGRKPSLAVITVGDLKRYKHSERRLEIYSDSSNSWFAKGSTGDANGFDVQEIQLDSSITTNELLKQLDAVKDAVDGIQLMWPLPDHIDSGKVYSAIDVAKDVDGIHYIGQREVGNKKAYPPVTTAAVEALIDEFDVDVKSKRVLVIGRSPIVGSPTAHMLREKGAVVTTAHSQVAPETLKELVGEAEVIVICAGEPGLIQAEWIKGADVINVGTTFDEDRDELVSDVEGDVAKYANRYSPVPGGIGPLSAPLLLKNVAKAAWDQKM